MAKFKIDHPIVGKHHLCINCDGRGYVFRWGETGCAPSALVCESCEGYGHLLFTAIDQETHKITAVPYIMKPPKSPHGGPGQEKEPVSA
jgi:hypothetical protein